MYSDREIEIFFFKAMMRGWVSGKSPSTFTGLPGLQVITVMNGVFQLTDQWMVGDQGRSAGMTTITADGKPVWAMQYRGEYSEAVTAFLSRALRTAYRDGRPVSDPRHFLGCRGPRCFRLPESSWMYTNNPTPGSNFWDFSGVEQIITADGLRLGWHEYTGMRLTGASIV